LSRFTPLIVISRSSSRLPLLPSRVPAPMPPLHIPKIEDYGISAELGFLSSQCPAASFGDDSDRRGCYARWDELIARLPRLISSRTHRSEIRALPTLDAGELASSEAALHRAYVVLGFLIHAYVWGGRGEEPVEIVPPQLAVPFLDVCSRLGMHPVLSYAGLCLWNWKVRHDAGPPRGEEGFFELDQLEGLASFTGTRGEDAFNHVPVLVEATGGPLIPLLLDAVSTFSNNNNNNNNNNTTITNNNGKNTNNNNIKITRDTAAYVREVLANASKIIAAMGRHLAKLYSTLDAQMFYHELRPFLAGGKSMEESGLARGFVFQLADGTERPVQHGGGSAAQSSLFHFLDAILGVEHEQPRDGSGSLFRVRVLLFFFLFFQI
jgi:indoleamine 2,3-dioxygenase